MPNYEPAAEEPQDGGALPPTESTPGIGVAETVPAPAEEPRKATPDEWADEVFPSSGGRQHPQFWQHGAAAALHKWAAHAHHNDGAIRITRAAYDAAIYAALTPDEETYTPHADALGKA